MEIRQAGPADLPTVYELEQRCFPNEAWSWRVFQEELAGPDSRYLLAVTPEGPIGYIAASFSARAGFAHITSLAVSPDHQRQGVGAALLAEMLRQMEAVGIHRFRAETRLGNEHVQRLFLRHGFYREMIISGYYQRPMEDAVVLLRDAMPILR